VLGRGGVPTSGVGAVALNVTVTNPTTASFLTVFPSGGGRPTAANLNYTVGQTSSNMVIVKVGSGGRISLFNLSGRADLIVDVLGWFPDGPSFSGLSPARLMDSRRTPPPPPTAPPTTLPPVVTPPPTPATTVAPPTTPPPVVTAPPSNCNPNYTPCVPFASDVDCAGGGGNGPVYVQGPVIVIGNDVYGLDSDGDGIGCE
jgi:hypothetical protein